MAKKGTTTISIDKDVQEQATDIFKELGISFSTAVEMFCRATVRCKGLPFSTTLDNNQPRVEYSVDSLEEQEEV